MKNAVKHRKEGHDPQFSQRFNKHCEKIASRALRLFISVA